MCRCGALFVVGAEWGLAQYTVYTVHHNIFFTDFLNYSIWATCRRQLSVANRCREEGKWIYFLKMNWSVLTIYSCNSFEFFICRPHRLRATQRITQQKTENSNPFHWTIGQLNTQVCSRFNIYVDQVWSFLFFKCFSCVHSRWKRVSIPDADVLLSRARVCVCV